MMAMPRPEHYSDMVELPRAFACHDCGARVALTTADPLPPGWRVTAGAEPLYTCPRCARARRRPGGRSAEHAAKSATKPAAHAQCVEVERAPSPAPTTTPVPAPTPVSTPSSTPAPDAPTPRRRVGGVGVGAWIFFCPCGFERRELARFLVHAATCRARRTEERATS